MHLTDLLRTIPFLCFRFRIWGRTLQCQRAGLEYEYSLCSFVSFVAAALFSGTRGHMCVTATVLASIGMQVVFRARRCTWAMTGNTDISLG